MFRLIKNVHKKQQLLHSLPQLKEAATTTTTTTRFFGQIFRISTHIHHQRSIINKFQSPFLKITSSMSSTVPETSQNNPSPSIIPEQPLDNSSLQASALPETTVIQVCNSIRKSENDKCEYRVIRLGTNQLECMLISDASADSSACALNVRVGNMEDPSEFIGLAHFCEHMLSLGTAKYPNESEYKTYLSKNGGSSNASTGILNTTYHFGCANGESFDGALDRFSQLFISPLFTESCTQREIGAIENEHRKNFPNDARRLYQISRSTSKPGQPYNKFGSGNQLTLDKPGVREALLAFYAKYYSANQMNLSLYSNWSLDEMQAVVAKYFSAIPNSNIEPIQHTEMPFGEQQLAKYIKWVPVGQSDMLTMRWQVEFHEQYYKSKPIEYISHLLGHESEGSLLSFLIAEGLAYELSSGVSESMKLYSEMQVSISLTKQGQANIDRVVHAVVTYVELLRTTPVQKWIWEEIKTMKDLFLQMKEKSTPVSQALLYARKIAEYPHEDLCISAYLMDTFDETLIQKYLAQLTLSNLRIINASKSIESECDKIEEIYGTKYSIEDISSEMKAMISSPGALTWQTSKAKMSLPTRNPFIPKNLQLVKTEEAYVKYPVMIYDSKATRVWFKQDEIFKTPKGQVELTVFWKNLHGLNGGSSSGACGSIMQYIHMQIFKDNIRGIKYLAQLANISDSRSSSELSYTYTVCGFSESIGRYTKEFVERLLAFHNPNADNLGLEWLKSEEIQEKLVNFIEKKRINLKNSLLLSPHQMVGRVFSSITDYKSITVEDQIAFLDAHSNEEIIEMYRRYHANLFDAVRFEWTFVGNFVRDESISLAVDVENAFFNQLDSEGRRIGIAKRVLEPEEIEYGRTVQLEKDVVLVNQRFESGKGDAINSACFVGFQLFDSRLEMRDDSAIEVLFKSVNRMSILQLIFKMKFYSTLRTKEQLGYIVQSSVKRVNKVSFWTFLVQSSTKSPMFVAGRITEFLEGASAIIEAMTEEEIQEFVQSLRVQYLKKPLSIYEEAQIWTGLVSTQTMLFDLSERLIADLDTIRKEDITRILRRIFEEERRQIEIHLVSPIHVEEQKTLAEERVKSLAAENEKRNQKIVFTQSGIYARNMLKLFPSYTKFIATKPAL